MVFVAQPIYIIRYFFRELHTEFISGERHILSHILEDNNSSVLKLQCTLQILI